MTPTPPTVQPVRFYQTAWFKWLAPFAIGLTFRVACPLIENPQGHRVCEIAQSAWEQGKISLFTSVDGGTL